MAPSPPSVRVRTCKLGQPLEIPGARCAPVGHQPRLPRPRAPAHASRRLRLPLPARRLPPSHSPKL